MLQLKNYYDWNTSKGMHLLRKQMRELLRKVFRLVVYLCLIPFFRQKMQEMDLSPISIDDI